MRIDPRQPIIWNSDPSQPGGPFWQMDAAGWMRQDDSGLSPNTRKVSVRTFLLVAIPVITLLISLGVYGAISVLWR